MFPPPPLSLPPSFERDVHPQVRVRLLPLDERGGLSSTLTLAQEAKPAPKKKGTTAAKNTASTSTSAVVRKTTTGTAAKNTVTPIAGAADGQRVTVPLGKQTPLGASSSTARHSPQGEPVRHSRRASRPVERLDPSDASTFSERAHKRQRTAEPSKGTEAGKGA